MVKQLFKLGEDYPDWVVAQSKEQAFNFMNDLWDGLASVVSYFTTGRQIKTMRPPHLMSLLMNMLK